MARTGGAAPWPVFTNAGTLKKSTGTATPVDVAFYPAPEGRERLALCDQRHVVIRRETVSLVWASASIRIMSNVVGWTYERGPFQAIW